jgi:YD repeat-containing protein
MISKKPYKNICYSIIFVLFLFNIYFVRATDSYRPYLHDPKVPEHKTLNLMGKYDTNIFSGAATYKLPIDVPPGTNKLAPQISIVYNSHSTFNRPSFLGTGWDLSQNYILRNIEHSSQTRRDDTFELYLNGAKYDLIYVEDEKRFHSEVENFLFIKNYSGGLNENDTYWIVKDKNGVQYRFGFNNDSELINSHDIVARWSLDLINDTHNNSVFYSYLENPYDQDSYAVYLDKIEYNNDKKRKIEFILDSNVRTDLWYNYVQGNPLRESRRLSEIVVSADDELVSRYVINYIGLNTSSRLSIKNITKYGSDNVTALPSTKFQYHELGEGWTYDSTWEPPTDAAFVDDSTGNDEFVRLAELNGDGLIDIIKRENCGTASCKGAWINNGAGWTYDSTWEPPADAGFDEGTLVMDVNNDGRDDLIKRQDCSSASCKGSWINNGAGWSTDSAWDPPQDAAFEPIVRIADVNGDGYPDILKRENCGSSSCYGAWTNNGYGWTSDVNWIPPSDAAFVNSGDEDLGVRVVDVNGDGLPDLIKRQDCGSSSCYGAWINHGYGWSYDSTWEPPSDAAFSDDTTGEDEGVRFADLNSDGLIDLIKRLDCSSSPCYGAWINHGAGWSYNSDWITSQDAAFVDTDGENEGVRLADVNGDGVIDILKRIDCTSSSCKGAWLSKASKAFLLKNVSNEMGGSTFIDYNKSTSFDNTGDDSKGDLDFNLWVVKSVTKSNGVDSIHNVTGEYHYNYAGGKYDYGDEEFRGFRYSSVSNPDDSIINHWFHQDDATKTKEFRTETYNSSNSLIKNVTHTYNYTELNDYYTTLLEFTTEYVHEGFDSNPKIINTSYGYDEFGNIIEIDYYADVSKNSDDKFEYYEYVNNSEKWIVNRKKHIKVLDSDNQSIVSESWFSYDNLSYGSAPTKGDLTLKEDYLSGYPNPITRYSYDNFGNIINETDANNNSKLFIFGINDDTNTFSEKEIDNEGHITNKTYDLGTGKIVSQSDSNGNVINYSYDSFGRIKKEILPYDSANYPTKEYEYDMDGVAPESIVIKKRENSGEDSTYDTYYFYDGFGNLIQTKREGEGSKQIISNFFFDGQNRIVKIINPYLNTSNQNYSVPNDHINYTRYDYDPLGRVIQVTNPDGTIINVIITPNNVTDIDENDNMISYKIDANDQIIQVIEYLFDEEFVTNYSYDVMGNLLQINDSAGNMFNYSYDEMGRKLVQEDPDLGTWSYSYDGVGNIVQTVDNRGEVVDQSYDGINRIVKKNGTDSTIIHVYDINYNNTL